MSSCCQCRVIDFSVKGGFGLRYCLLTVTKKSTCCRRILPFCYFFIVVAGLVIASSRFGFLADPAQFSWKQALPSSFSAAITFLASLCIRCQVSCMRVLRYLLFYHFGLGLLASQIPKINCSSRFLKISESC